jgi:hypothetical protein
MAGAHEEGGRAMSAIVLLDTVVYLNVLDIMGWNQDRVAVLDQFKSRMENGDYFLLPMATIWGTGNHIADLHDGGLRRKFAQKFVEDVEKAISGGVPYKATYFPEREIFRNWIKGFPEYAMRNKSTGKTGEGISLADFSIIKEWEQTCATNNMSRVLIWSLDCDLAGYDRPAHS